MSQVELDDEAANLFARYSKALTNQGLLFVASKYLKGCDIQEFKDLCDQIYRSCICGFCPDLIASLSDFP